MKLNLSILFEDLRDYKPIAKIKTGRRRCALDFAAFPEANKRFKANVAYITTAEELAKTPLSFLERSPSIICVGTPPESYLKSTVCNAIWIEEAVSVNALLIKVCEIFNSYEQWVFSLQHALARNMPLRILGDLSSEIFKKPLWAWDRHYQTLFNVVDRQWYDVPLGYAQHEEYAPWPLWEVNAWKDGGYIDIDAVLKLREPYILPNTDLFDYRALAYNLFVGEEYMATITVEEVGSSITNRDYALIEKLGSALCQGLKRDKSLNLSMTSDTATVLEKLLNQQPVPESKLLSAIGSIGWAPEGPFSCIVARPANPLYSDNMLLVAATKACDSLAGVVYVIDQHEIVFIVNTRLIDGVSSDVVETIIERLHERRYQSVIGVSTAFAKIVNLYHYRRQATDALEIGLATQRPEEGPTNDVSTFFFEDYMLDFIIGKCLTQVLPDTLYPPGLTSLIDYDQDSGNDLCLTLHTYLENNMQIAETARQLFMHRNTLINKLRKIDSILLSDLSDPSTRLLLTIAFRIRGNSMANTSRANEALEGPRCVREKQATVTGLSRT